MILDADLRWRPVEDIRVGDELIAIDEYGPLRHYRRSVVKSNSRALLPLLRIVTPRGTILCPRDLYWLTRTYKGRQWEWFKASELRPPFQLLHALDVWSVDRSYDAGWLAGMLDGEGCLTFKSSWAGLARLSITQVEGPTAEKITKALGSLGVTVGGRSRPASQEPQHQRRRDWEVSRRPDIMKILGSIRPERLMVNADQVWEGFSFKGHDRITTISSVEDAGTGAVSRLSTSTKTYIEDGFAMRQIIS